MKRICHLPLLILGCLTGCRVVLPTCAPSQLWPKYVEQQGTVTYVEQYGNCNTCSMMATGTPAVDFRQGFENGFRLQATNQLGIGPGAPPLCGWGWVQNGKRIPQSAAYDQGYQSGVASAAARFSNGITR